MKKTINNQKGFTLIELILCVAIVGMMTAAIAPSFQDLLANSTEISGKGVAGAVQSAINTQMGENLLDPLATTTWPTALDTGANGVCSTLINGCFTSVLAQGLFDDTWTKSGLQYTYAKNGITMTYEYFPSNGQFKCMTGC